MAAADRFSLACEFMVGQGGRCLELTSEEKLCLYGLYKQASVGNADVDSRPNMVDFIGRAKW